MYVGRAGWYGCMIWVPTCRGNNRGIIFQVLKSLSIAGESVTVRKGRKGKKEGREGRKGRQAGRRAGREGGREGRKEGKEGRKEGLQQWRSVGR